MVIGSLKKRASVLAYLSLSTIGLAGCHAGGNITASIASVAPSPVTASPTIAAPGVSPYYSNTGSITISGVCNNASTVSISGDYISQTTCANNTYSFTVSKAADSVYSFYLTQSSASGASSPTLFAWIKKSSVAIPLILAPSSSTYLSGEPVLTISGQCENNATILLSGDGTGSTVCAGSLFALTLPKAVDGDYNLTVTQKDAASNTASVALIWKKHALTIVQPTTTTVPAGTTLPFVLSGGSGPGTYTEHATDIQSGGQFNTDGSYTVGPHANVVDTLTITDQANSSQVIHLSVTAGGPDHLEFATISGDGQSGPAGQVLTVPLKAQLVDANGNGLHNYQLLFQTIQGEAAFTSSALQTTDAQGFVSINVRPGFGSTNFAIQLKSVSTILPDVNETGRGTITFAGASLTYGNSKLGTLYTAGTNPNSVAAGDFDGDGKSDLVVLSNTVRAFYFLKGHGDGTFGSPILIPTSCVGSQIVTGHFRAAAGSALDLAATCTADKSLNIYLGNGDGTFASALRIDTSGTEQTPSGLIVADFNGDGKLDLASTSISEEIVAVRFGLGNGSFAAPSLYPIDTAGSGRVAGPIAAGKVKHAALPDIVATMTGSTVGALSVLANDGTGHFGTYVHYDAGTSPSSVAVGDMDGDGYAEVLFTDTSTNRVTMYLNTGGTFDPTNKIDYDVAATVNGRTAQTPTAVTIADFDGDGKNDFAVIDNDPSALITFTSKNGTGYSYVQTILATGTSPVFLGTSDVNGDGTPDLIVANSGSNDVQVVPVQTDGTIDYVKSVGNGAAAVRTADFNGDGNYDLAVLNQGDKSISVLLGNGNGFYSLKGNLTTMNSPADIITGDFNLDGKIDIAVVGNGLLHIYFGAGDGTFPTGTEYGAGGSPASLLSRDFNGDGLPDIAVVSQTAQAVDVFINQKTVTAGVASYAYANYVPYAVGGGPAAITAVDVNNDHYLDLVVVNSTGNNVSVLVSNQNGTFQTQVTYPTGNNPGGIVSGDFNGDGKVDLAVVGTTTVDVLFGQPDGSFGAISSYSCGNSPGAIVLGDFNGDQKIDIAVANNFPGAYGFTVLYGESNGQFNVSEYHSTAFAMGPMRVTDANADGKLDLAIVSSSGNFIQMWMGH